MRSRCALIFCVGASVWKLTWGPKLDAQQVRTYFLLEREHLETGFGVKSARTLRTYFFREHECLEARVGSKTKCAATTTTTTHCFRALARLESGFGWKN